MPQYKTPNVYVQEKSIFPPSVAEVATAIPAFIGRTEIATYAGDKSLVNKPMRITSMVEYAQWFGGSYGEAFHFVRETETVIDRETGNSSEVLVSVKPDPTKKPTPLADFILYHMLAQFFANGGGACYVVSVGSYADAMDTNGAVASSAKNNGEKALFEKALKAIEQVDEVTLIVQSDGIPRMETATVGDVKTNPYNKLCEMALAQCADTQDRFAIIDTIDTFDPLDADTAKSSVMRADQTLMRKDISGPLLYGAAYYPNLVVATPRSYDESKVMLGDDTMASLAGTPAHAMLSTALGSNYMHLPPAASMAGVYSRVDGNRGVWKAPANVPVSGVVKPSRKITDDEQADMNVDATSGKSINAIRSFTGKGTLVWGARTLAGNDNEWRYVPVRRLFNMVEESVQKATAFAVFEPNVPLTWLKLRTMISSYLETLWRQGALFGATADQAFFVNVGLGQTMTEDDINNGIMNIEIGMAAVRPAEFIVLTFSHKSISG